MSPYSPRSLRLSDRVSTSSPGAWETAGRRWPSSPAVEWMVPGRPQRRRRARVRKGPRSPSGPHPLGLRRQGRRHRRRRAPRHPRRSEGMSFRGSTMARGTAAFRRGETCAPGGGSGQPCREWTKGSHSPDPRRAARRCSSRERGDWPGPAGRACTGGRRPERRRAAPAQRGRARARAERGAGTRTAGRTYPSAEPQPRGGLTQGSPRLTIRRLGTTLRPPAPGFRK